MNEQWKSVIGFEGWYEVSNHGRVRSVRRIATDGKTYQSKLRSLLTSTNGYLTVDLYRNGKRTTRTVHSLVAEAFIGPRPEGKEVCHGRSGQLVNRVGNLRYDTRAGNFTDKKHDGTEQIGERHWNSKLSDKERREVRRDRNLSNAEWAARLGVSRSIVSMIRNGKRGSGVK